MNPEFDVVVFGCGPAGATIARCLSRLQHSVALIQRERRSSSWPRWESLSPGALSLLQFHHEDIWPKIESLLIPCRSTILWAHEDVLNPRDQHAILVDRNLLDLLLLASAEAAGARRVDGAPASSRFVIDAGGRASAFPAARLLLGPSMLSLSAQVADIALRPRSTLVESLENGWLWAGRGDHTNSTVMFFLSPRLVSRWPASTRTSTFCELLQRSSLAVPGTCPQLVSKITVRDATPAQRKPVESDRMLRVGDSALALDPMSGQGVQHALTSASQAAAVLHTLLVREGSAAFAREFFQSRHVEAAREHTAAFTAFYRRQNRYEGDFWRERVGEDLHSTLLEPSSERPSLGYSMHERLVVSKEARWKETPVMAGEFISAVSALYHPSLTRPVAYLEGRLASELLNCFSGSMPGIEWLDAWRTMLPDAARLRAFRFVTRHGILQPERTEL